MIDSLSAGVDARVRTVQVSSTGDRQRDFAAMLGREMSRADAGQETPEQRARTAAEGFVSTALVEPLLKAVREANEAPAPWGPSDVEKRFGGLIDAERATQIVRSSSFPIVDRLARDLLQRSAGQEVPDGSLTQITR